MSRHWIPDGDRTRWTPAARSWPKGATAGLMLVAAGCLAIGLLLYKAATPGYEIEKSAAGDWNAVAHSSRD